MAKTAELDSGKKKADVANKIGIVALIVAAVLGAVFALNHYGMITVFSAVEKTLVVSIASLIVVHFMLRFVAAYFTKTIPNTEEDND